MKLSEWLSLFDFGFETDNGKIALVDQQGANLGDIESDRFDTVAEVMERMDIYICDSLLDGEILIDEKGKDFNDIQEAYDYCKANGYEDVLPYLYAVLNPDTVEID